MLTIKHRLNDRLQSVSHVLPTQINSSDTIPELTNEELIDKINKIKEENEYIHRENLFFSRYLLRINAIKIVTTFHDYDDENDILLEIQEQIESSNASQRLAIKKSSSNAKKGISGWTKVSVNWSEHLSASYISRLEHERFAIASYEAEQTRLEWKRMKANADATLYHLEVLYQSIQSDEIAQELLNRDLERRVSRYRADIGEEEFNNPYLQVSAELVVSRINKRISSRISTIGLLRVNSTRLHIRIGEINTKIRSLDDLNVKMDEVDIDSVRTKKLDHSETYEKLDQKYRIEKASEQPLFHRLQDYKRILDEQERNIIEMNEKCELLQNHLERTLIELTSVEEEHQLVFKENHLLKDRIANVKKVPSITDYAHVIEQTKCLQHGIDIWMKRVIIAETLITQFERQKKPPRRLPALLPTVHGLHRLMKPSNE